jgi:hypothetical protein
MADSDREDWKPIRDTMERVMRRLLRPRDPGTNAR